MSFLLGIDIGTSACKAAVFTPEGILRGSASADYRVSYPRPGWAEQDPRDWWNGACVATIAALQNAGISGAEIAAVGVDGVSWSAIPVDVNGRELGTTPLWMDTRAADLCRRLLREKVEEKRLFQCSCNSLRPGFSLPKILFLKEYQPDLYAKTRYFLQCNSYIVMKLTGVMSMDRSQAYGFACWNPRNSTFDEQLCQEMGFDSESVPPLYECTQVVGTVTAAAAAETGLQRGTPVVAGGLDAACATLGAGVVYPGQTQEQGGQAGGMSICLETVQGDPRLIFGCHVVPDRYLLQGGTVGGGGVMRWLSQEIFPELSLMEMDRLAEETPPGAEGLLFLPYLAGERSPLWNEQAQGTFFGFSYQKDRRHLIRAAMEGVCLSLRHNLAVAEEAGVFAGTLRATGGAARSAFWTQLKADITGHTVEVAAAEDATAKGAALLAGMGIGLYHSLEEAVSTIEVVKTYEPRKEYKDCYQQSFERYLQLVGALQPLMKEEKR